MGCSISSGDGVIDPERINSWPNLWQSAATVLVALGFAGSILVFVLKPYGDTLAQHAAEIEKINTTMAPLLTLYAQHTSDLQVLKTMQTELDEKLSAGLFTQDQTSLQRQLAEIVGQLHTLEQNIVPRSENTNKWTELGARIDAAARDIEALRLRMDKVGSPKQ